MPDGAALSASFTFPPQSGIVPGHKPPPARTARVPGLSSWRSSRANRAFQASLLGDRLPQLIRIISVNRHGPPPGGISRPRAEPGGPPASAVRHPRTPAGELLRDGNQFCRSVSPRLGKSGLGYLGLRHSRSPSSLPYRLRRGPARPATERWRTSAGAVESMHELARNFRQARAAMMSRRYSTFARAKLCRLASQRHWPLTTICYDIASGGVSDCHGERLPP